MVCHPQQMQVVTCWHLSIHDFHAMRCSVLRKTQMANIYFSSQWCCPLLIWCFCQGQSTAKPGLSTSFLLQEQKSGSLIPLCCWLGSVQGPFHEALELQQ